MRCQSEWWPATGSKSETSYIKRRYIYSRNFLNNMLSGIHLIIVELSIYVREAISIIAYREWKKQDGGLRARTIYHRCTLVWLLLSYIGVEWTDMREPATRTWTTRTRSPMHSSLTAAILHWRRVNGHEGTRHTYMDNTDTVTDTWNNNKIRCFPHKGVGLILFRTPCPYMPLNLWFTLTGCSLHTSFGRINWALSSSKSSPRTKTVSNIQVCQLAIHNTLRFNCTTDINMIIDMQFVLSYTQIRASCTRDKLWWSYRMP
jgi:hypothetical protein